MNTPQHYLFSDGEHLQATREELQQWLAHYKLYLQNYADIDLESPEYVARGNGFCDAKYSENFIEGQIHKYEQRIADIQKWLKQE